VVPRWEPIFADTQKKVKHHDYKVCRCGLARQGLRFITSGHCKVNGVDRKRYLGFGGRIAHPRRWVKGKARLSRLRRDVGWGILPAKACAT
jgi:hypothetical protein